MEGINSYFQIAIKEDGTYLNIYKAVKDGELLSQDIVHDYLKRHEIYNYDIRMITKALSSNKNATIKLTNDIHNEISEEMTIEISKDKMKAYAVFYPPSEKGDLLEMSQIEKVILKSEIAYGKFMDEIETFINDRKYLTPYLIAKGKDSVEGKEGRIEYYFKTDEGVKTQTNDDGTVDFETLDFITEVEKGTLVAKVIPSVKGQKGINVLGMSVPCFNVKKMILKCGKNIVTDEEEFHAYAKKNGNVYIKNGEITLSTVHIIDSDVEAGSGILNYKGDVHITGSIREGSRIKAEGNIIVDGVIESSILHAGGNIIAKRGIKGGKKGLIYADCDLISKFIENAYIIVGGNIKTDSILHSKVIANGSIKLTAQKGVLIGGISRAIKSINCKSAGSHMGTATILQLGSNKHCREEISVIEMEIEQNEEEQISYLRAIKSYKDRIQNNSDLSAEDEEVLRKLIKKNSILTRKLEVLKLERDAFTRYMKTQLSHDSKITVEGRCCVGVKVDIDDAIYNVKKEALGVKFELHNEEITFTRCRQ